MHGSSDLSLHLSERQRSELLALAERVAGVGHWLIELNTNALFWSPQVYRIHGLTPDTYIPSVETAIDFYHPEDVDDVRQVVEDAIANCRPYEFECRLIRADRSIRTVHAKATVNTGRDGKAAAVFGTFQDVTDRRQTEEELRKINERFEVAIKGSKVGLWDWNLKTDEVYWSPRSREIVGIEDQGFKPYLDDFEARLHANDRERVKQEIAAHVEQRVPFDTDYRLRRRGGGYRWVHAAGQASWDESGEPLRMAGSMIDISDRKLDELMREEVYRLLTDEDRGTDDHINELLAIALGYLDLDVGMVSRIDGDDYEIRHVVGSDEIQAGTKFDLEQTFCATTVARHEVTAVAKAGETELAEHPCYAKFGFEAYIGIPLIQDGKAVGTVSFSSSTAREFEFKARERSFVAMVAKWVSYELSQQESLQQLRQKERELDIIFNTAPVRIWYKDDANRILRLNEQAAESMGLSVAEAEGADSYDLFPDMAGAYHEKDLEAIESGEPLLNVVERYTPRFGESGWMRTHRVPFDDPATKKRRVVIVSRDITAEMNAGAAGGAPSATPPESVNGEFGSIAGHLRDLAARIEAGAVSPDQLQHLEELLDAAEPNGACEPSAVHSTRTIA